LNDNRAVLSDPDLLTRAVVATGGKGGVGKTTTASALALYFAEVEHQETLIISSDPTPSLSDIFEQDLGVGRTRINGPARLHGQELNREVILEAWKDRFGEEIYQVISSYLPVDREIIDYVAEAPGLADEQYILAYILDLLKSGSYDKIIWDTAPAGATLGLLKLESRFYDHLNDAASLYVSMRSHLERLGERLGLKKRRSALDIIDRWKDLADEIMETLRDPEKAEFVIVTIPEGLGVSQTRRVINELDEYGISVRHVVVNHVIPESVVAGSSFLQSRQRVQRSYLNLLSEQYEGMLTVLPQLPGEVKGIDALRRIRELLKG
jgi:arsenite-transporting ATPase